VLRPIVCGSQWFPGCPSAGKTRVRASPVWLQVEVSALCARAAKRKVPMRMRLWLRLEALALAGLLVVAGPLGAPLATETVAQDDAVPPSPEQILDRAFTNQYDVDTTSTVDLVIRNDSGQERRRRFESASKIIEDRLHSIGRLTYPGYLRGMTILQIETDGQSHDAFVYLPSMRAVRRITTAQRGDAFFGTDVTYEDLERRRASDYEVLGIEATEVEGEATFLIRAEPLTRVSYDEVHFSIAASDSVILEARYFKRGEPDPYRIISAPRTGMHEAGGHILPTRLIVQNRSRGTTTEVTYHDLRVNPEIDDRLFSIRTLEQRRDIPKAR